MKRPTFSPLIYRWGDWGLWSLSILLKVPQVASGLHLNTGTQTPPWRRKWQLTPVFLPEEWADEPGGLQSIVSQRVRRDWTQASDSKPIVRFTLCSPSSCYLPFFFFLHNRRFWLAIRLLELKGIFEMICPNSLILWRRKPEAHRWLPDGSHWAAFHSFAFSAIS